MQIMNPFSNQLNLFIYKILPIYGLSILLSPMGLCDVPSEVPIPDPLSVCPSLECGTLELEALAAALRNLTPGDRYKFASTLLTRLHTATDPSVIESYRSVSNTLVSISQSLADEEWVIRQEKQIMDDATEKIILLGEPALDFLKTEFSKLSNEAARFRVLQGWLNRLPLVAKREALSALTEFSRFAEGVAMNAGDSDYVSRSAQQLRESITVRLLTLYPQHEGVYQITVRGLSGLLAPDRFVFIESNLPGRGLVAEFSRSDSGNRLFSFSQVLSVDGLDRFEAKPTKEEGVNLLDFTVNINATTGRVHGIIKTIDHGDLIFDGTRLFSTVETMDAIDSGADQQNIEGTWQAKFGDYNGSMVIRTLDANRIGAVFKRPNSPARIRFRVQYFQVREVVYLSYGTPDGNTTKVVLKWNHALQKWVGNGMSTAGGVIYPATLIATPTESDASALELK